MLPHLNFIGNSGQYKEMLRDLPIKRILAYLKSLSASRKACNNQHTGGTQCIATHRRTVPVTLVKAILERRTSANGWFGGLYISHLPRE